MAQKTATKTWLFLLYFWFILSQFLCLFPLVSPYFLLFHAILESQNSPPSEVTGRCITTWALFRVLHASHSAWWCSHAVVSLSVPYLPNLLFPGPLLSLSLSLPHPSLPVLVLCFGSVCMQAAACNIRDKPSFMTTIVLVFPPPPIFG